jgi:biotin operon repressor
MTSRKEILQDTVMVLKQNVDAHKFVDVGAGAAKHLGVSQAKLYAAVQTLKDDGFQVHLVTAIQQADPQKVTAIKVLTPPGTKWSEVNAQKNLISQIDSRNEEEE